MTGFKVNVMYHVESWLESGEVAQGKCKWKINYLFFSWHWIILNSCCCWCKDVVSGHVWVCHIDCDVLRYHYDNYLLIMFILSHQPASPASHPAYNTKQRRNCHLFCPSQTLDKYTELRFLVANSNSTKSNIYH